MGKASRKKRERQDTTVPVTGRALPLLVDVPVRDLGEWDSADGYATGAAAALLSERGADASLVAAYRATGLLPTGAAAAAMAPEELLVWGAALRDWETAHWDEFTAARPDLQAALTTNPGAALGDTAVGVLADVGWALSVGWPTSAAGAVVDVVGGDDDEIDELTQAAVVAVATLKNEGVFTNAVTRACIQFGDEFNVGELVRSYLGVANFEPAVVRVHAENSAAVMLTVHAAIVAGAFAAGGVDAARLDAAARFRTHA